MNKLKRTLALVATLALASTAFVACGDKDSSSTATTTKAPAADTTTAAGGEEGDTTAAAETGEMKFGDDGKEVTFLSWNTEFIDMVHNYYCVDKGWTNTGSEEAPVFEKDGVKINPQNQKCDGGKASEAYDAYFLTGADVDFFLMEADWALYYVDSDKTASVSDLGITKSEMANQYGYTQDIVTDKSGNLKGLTWQAAPGGFAYRTSLAEEYLGVKTPAEMQEKVKDWSAFEATAKTVSEKTNGETALAASLGGIWQVFSSNRAEAWVKDGSLNVSQDCKDFMEMAKTFYTNGYATKESQWDGAWWSNGNVKLSSGNYATMGYFVSTWGVGSAILEKAAGNTYDENGKLLTKGDTYGDWSMCVGPTAYFWGGTWLAPAPSCDNGTIVADIMRYFTCETESMKKYAEGSQDFVNNKASMQAIVDAGHKNENLGGQSQYDIFIDAAGKIDLSGKLTSNDATIKADFADAYMGYCKGDYASVDAALEAFAKKVAADTGIE